MRSFPASVGLVVVLVLMVPVRGAATEPTPDGTSGRAGVKAPSRDDLPRCDELRLTADEMAAAFQKHAEATGDAPEGQEAFDAIGDELGCRWPWSPEDSRRGLMQLLEKSGSAGGRPGTAGHQGSSR